MRKLICVLSLVMFFGCSSKNDIYSNTYSGTLELTEHVLGAKVAGRIISLDVNEGDMVKPSQVIATLDHYEQAKKDYERVEPLLTSGGASAQDIEHAKLAMEDQQIVSPVQGVVLLKAAELGEVVSAGAGVVVVGNPQEQWIKIFLPEGQIGQVRMGQIASVHVDGLNKSYQGHVSFIAPKGEFTPRNLQAKEDRLTQAFAVKITVDHPDEFVHPGVSAEVRFKK